jgi:hypothetical protein
MTAVRLCYSPPSFRLGSAKTKLAGSIPALPTSRKASGDVPRWQSN